jgi:hypothetical protein
VQHARRRQEADAEPRGQGLCTAVVRGLGDRARDGDLLRETDGAADLRLTVTVFVPFGEDRAAWEALMPYLADEGAKSVRAIVAADPTLGGVVDSALVLTARNAGPYNFGPPERRFLGAEFPVEVFL